MTKKKIDRREFVGQAGRVAAGLSLGTVALAEAAAAAAPKAYAQAASKSPRGPGEKIRLGFIGTGGRCRQLMPTFLASGEIETMAICDVKQDALEKARKIVGDGPPAVEDYRDILNRDDVDAVVIGTPDHWHAIIAIEACQAGKDVYVEKPLALCVEEGRRIVQAARKHGRIVQMGTQQLSGEHYHQAREEIHSGRIGKVSMVRIWNFRNRYPGHGHPPDTEAPNTINWDRWLGPRPWAPYNRIKAKGSFRDFWEYAGGVLTDWGTHHIHTVLDIMGYDPPSTVGAAGGRYVIDDLTTTPDTLSVLYQFKDWTLEYSNRDTNGKAPYNSEYGIEFCGHEGTLYINRAGYAIYTEKDRSKPEEIVRTEEGNDWVPLELDQSHVGDFLECVRTRKAPNSEVELGHKATTLSHLGNIAFRVGRQIRWDGDAESIRGDSEADDLLRRNYRSPYLLPEV